MPLTITKPDDWHVHLRDGTILAAVAPATARCFGRAIVMPNLDPPVTTVAAALAYRGRILAAVGDARAFEPLMTLYLTDRTTPDTIHAASAAGIAAVKMYPAGATTHSASGVTNPLALDGVYRALSETGLPLLVHGEVTDHEVDIFDREAVFLDRVLEPIRSRYPDLRLVLEHVTTAEGVEFVRSAGTRTAATVTAHHLLLNRNALFAGGLRPHHYCLPVLKRERHRQALLDAVLGGHERFFLGTDSAPHARGEKESACGCAGVYTAPAAIELYAELFAQHEALDRLEGFASRFGPAFYGRPENRGLLELVEREWIVPEAVDAGGETIIPFRAGARIGWQVVEEAAS